MSNSDLIIEKMSVDVQASQVANPNVLLVEISAYLQEVVLPQLDLELDWDAKKLIQLEQVNIEFDSSNKVLWLYKP